MRASDAERERIAEVLRDAVAEGRLDMEEFEERPLIECCETITLLFREWSDSRRAGAGVSDRS